MEHCPKWQKIDYIFCLSSTRPPPTNCLQNLYSITAWKRNVTLVASPGTLLLKKIILSHRTSHRLSSGLNSFWIYWLAKCDRWSNVNDHLGEPMKGCTESFWIKNVLKNFPTSLPFMTSVLSRAISSMCSGGETRCCMNSATEERVAMQSELSLLNVLLIRMNNSYKHPVLLVSALQVDIIM